MKEIFDWMREQMLKRKSAWEEDSITDKVSAEKHIGTWNVALRILEKAETKWKEKCRETNVITSFLQYVRDNSDNPEYDNENGWSLADLIDLSIKFSNAKEHCDVAHDSERD